MTRLLVHLPFYTLGLALWFSALAAGGIHIPVLVTFAVLIAASGFFSSFSADLERGPPIRWQAGGLTVIASALALYCLLQTVPLPVHWLQALAPRSADIWARSLKPFALPAPEFASISLAPGRGLIEALEFASYAVVFAVSARLARRYEFQRMALLVFASALAVATVTTAHQLVGAHRLYGQYAPLNAYDIAPLLNPNNRAGYLNLGFFCGLGLLFRKESRPYLGLLGLGLCFIGAQVVLCRSLGGTSCLAIGAALAALLGLPGALRRRVRGNALSQIGRSGVVVVIAIGVLMLARAGQGENTFGLDAHSWQKVDLWRRAAQLANDYFALGVGRGAFASVFPAYQEPGKNLVFEYAENFPIQWAAEWGVPVTVLALLALGWCLQPLISRRTLQSNTRRCALVGCAMLLLQNLADLALEVPAVMALLCCVLGSFLGSDQQGRRAHATRDTSPGSGVLLASSALTLLCVGLAVPFGSDSTARLRHDLFEQLSAQSGPPSASFWSSLERAVRAYPAEPYFPLLGSTAALASAGNPLPWISRSLERNPVNPLAHLQLARILRAHGATSQALSALRQAIALDPTLTQTVPTLAREWKLGLDTFEDAAPLGRAGVPLLLLIADRTDDEQLRLHLLDVALDRDPADADVHYRIAWALLQALSRGDASSVCAGKRDACLEQIADHTRQAMTEGDSRHVVLEAWLLAERGQPQQAEQHLADGCRQFPGDVKCSSAWLARALKNDSPQLQEAVNAVVAAGCTDAEGCAATHLGIGNLFTNAGRWHSALTHFQQATQEASTTEAWQAVAQAAERIGDDTTVRNARRRVSLLARGNANAAGAAPDPTEPDRRPEPAPETLLAPRNDE